MGVLQTQTILANFEAFSSAQKTLMSTTFKTLKIPGDLPVCFMESRQAQKIFYEKCQTLFHLSCHPVTPLLLAMKFLSIKALEGKIITLFANSLWRGYTPAQKGLNFKFFADKLFCLLIQDFFSQKEAREMIFKSQV